MDLLSLTEYGISFSALARMALYYHVRGRQLHLYIPEPFSCDLTGQRLRISRKIVTNDPLTIRCLKEMILPGERMKFVRAVIRSTFMVPPSGTYYSDGEVPSFELELLQRVSPDDYKDIIICEPQGKKRQQMLILRPTLPLPGGKVKSLPSSETPVSSASDMSVLDLLKKNVSADDNSIESIRQEPDTAPTPFGDVSQVIDDNNDPVPSGDTDHASSATEMNDDPFALEEDEDDFSPGSRDAFDEFRERFS